MEGDDILLEPQQILTSDLTADATAAYKRVTPPRYDQLANAYQLAQRRLAAIARP